MEDRPTGRFVKVENLTSDVSDDEFLQANKVVNQAFEDEARQEEIQKRLEADRAGGSLIERLEAAKEKRERNHHAPNPRKISTRNTIVVQPLEQPEDAQQAFLTMTEALALPQADNWAAARDREIAQLEKYGVFEWVDEVPAGKKAIDTKWVLKEKEERHQDDPKRFKVCLTARGFTQRPEIDYNATYAPVAREESWRIVLSLALAEDLVIEVADIEGAFLNGPIEEEIYIKDPHATGNRAWRLLKALYGLKQSARNWNLFLDDLLVGLGFTKCPDDPGLYARRDKQGKIELVIAHVDDILTALKKETKEAFWSHLSKYVTIERKGKPETLLGMHLEWFPNSIKISGAVPINKLVSDTLDSPFRIVTSPYLSCPDGDLLAATSSYKALIGRLLFIARMWRPDIRYAVTRLCVKNHAPSNGDWQKALHVVKYLAGTPEAGIEIHPWTGTIEIFTDAGEEKLEEKATTGIIIKNGNTPIAWTARKQDVTVLSSTEAEYIALGTGCQDALWIRKVLQFLWPNDPPTPIVYNDNQGAATLSEYPDFHRRTKHIRRRHHFARECVQEGDLVVQWISGERNPADLLTKPIVGTRFTELKRLAGMSD